VTERATGPIDEAVAALQSGGVVVYPTETLYGLGADALNDEALERVVKLKGRDRDKPVSVLVASRAMLESLVSSIPEVAERLMARFWPGALTIAFPVRSGVSARLTGGCVLRIRDRSLPGRRPGGRRAGLDRRRLLGRRRGADPPGRHRARRGRSGGGDAPRPEMR
jgi:tRNA threonylcarbamoyl adenosine modification protein (Sua5/YciO/YrdC/YwlC family)